MRTLLPAALLLLAAISGAQDAPKPLAIALEPLGDRKGDVVTRVYFRFANPRQVTDAGLYLEGSFLQQGSQVPRNFHFPVRRKDDKHLLGNTVSRNGKLVRGTYWTVLPDKRNEMSAVQTFAEGDVEIDVRLVLETDNDGPPILVAEATQTFTVSKTNRPYAAETGDDDELTTADRAEPEVAPELQGAVTIRDSRRNAESGLFQVSIDALPPVKRVEFRVENRKILARNAPPYVADLDLGPSPKGVAVRAIGFDAAGHYVDADALAITEGETYVGAKLAVKITRTDTPDGLTHFKLSVRNPKRVLLRRIVLYAGDKKLYEWDRPPFTLSVPTASLAGLEVVRASVIDESGTEASDLAQLH
jgi:hypothetical protein